jgi:hypothetical protein
LGIVMPAILVCVLLVKATKFAKKGSGQIGEAVLKGAKIATGIAGGLAIGTTASVLQGSLGHLGKMVFENKTLTDAEARGNRFAKMARTLGGGAAKGSFDLRKGAAGGALKAVSAVTGLNLGHQSKFLLKESGGYEADLKRRDEKRKKRAEGLKLKEGEKEKQALNSAEEEKETLLEVGSHEMTQIDARIESAIKDSSAKSTKANTIDTKDPEKVKERKELIEKARSLPATTREEIETKTLAIKEAESMSIDDETKVKEKDEATKIAKTAADYVVSLRAQKSLIGNADANSVEDLTKTVDNLNKVAEAARIEAEKDPTNKDLRTKSIRAMQEATAAGVAVEVAKKAREIKSKGSINELGDNIIPNLKHEAAEVSKERERAYATNLEKQWAFPWNEAARKKSAHEIRMGIKAGTHKGGGHGGGYGVAGHLAADVAGAAIAEAVVGHSKDSHSSAPAGEAPKGR